MNRTDTIDKQKLEATISLIQKDDVGYYTSGKFVQTSAKLQIQPGNDSKTHQLYRLFLFIQQDLWNIETTISRLEWEKDLVNKDVLDVHQWSYHAAADIRIFHVEFRSIFDYVAKIISMISDSPRQSPDTFEKLKNWVSDSKNAVRLGQDLAQFVISCYWFDNLREVRNAIVHHGADALVFPNKGRILFLADLRNSRINIIPELRFNENVADFELYAGLYVGYLLSWLEDFSELVQKRVELGKYDIKSKSYHLGLPLVTEWINKLLISNHKTGENQSSKG